MGKREQVLLLRGETGGCACACVGYWVWVTGCGLLGVDLAGCGGENGRRWGTRGGSGLGLGLASIRRCEVLWGDASFTTCMGVGSWVDPGGLERTSIRYGVCCVGRVFVALRNRASSRERESEEDIQGYIKGNS